MGNEGAKVAKADTSAVIHRATYTLVRGVWHATCRVCGYQISDGNRQRAATCYREHIRATTGDHGPDVIDLRSADPSFEAGEPAIGDHRAIS